MSCYRKHNPYELFIFFHPLSIFYKATPQRRAGRRGRHRSRSNRRSTDSNSDIIDVESFPDGPTCIDLTEAPDHEFVDLTSVNQYTPIVIASSQSDTSTGPRIRTRRRRGGRGTFRSRESTIDSDDSGLDDLPPVPFSVPDNISLNTSTSDSSGENAANGAAANVSVTSPAKSIICPVCLENEKQIRRAGRQIVSTTCGHIFCNECVQSAIRAQKKCPNCRKKLNMKQFHPIFI